ncbi:MAG: hypothetical protein Q9181_004590 [Wetmoreana brouardii]
MPPNNLRANDGGLPEVSPYEGLQRHLPPNEEKQHDSSPSEGKEYYAPSDELPPDGLHVNHSSFSGPDAYNSHPYSHTTQPELNPRQAQEKRAFWKRKRFWIPLVCLLLIGAIVGGIAGGLSNRKAPPGTGGPTTLSGSTAPPAVSTVTPGPAQPSSKPLNSSLASVAWSSHDGIRYRRLYYQDDAGTVKESAWNNTADKWYLSNNNLANAKKGSPIAAAVAGNSTSPFQLNIYYINVKGHVVELYTKDGQFWQNGELIGEDIIPAPNSSLAATWSKTDHNSCKDCWQHTILLAYQDSDYKLWVSNSTGAPHPVLTPLEAHPSSGTGLAFQSVWHSQGSTGIRLYYQKGTDSLITIDYEDSVYGAQATSNKAWNWTQHEDSRVGSIAGGAKLASFSSGDDTETGDVLFQHTLSSGSRGVKVAWLGGGSNTGKGWQTDTPEVMKNVQAYSPLAANADRQVYALEDGVVKAFVMSQSDLTWSLDGDVLTEN